MTINKNTVRGWAYATRTDLRKIEPPVMAATIERFFAEPSVVSAPVIPSQVQIRQIIIEAVKQGPCQMPVTIAPRHVHVGRYRGCF